MTTATTIRACYASTVRLVHAHPSLTVEALADVTGIKLKTAMTYLSHACSHGLLLRRTDGTFAITAEGYAHAKIAPPRRGVDASIPGSHMVISSPDTIPTRDASGQKIAPRDDGCERYSTCLAAAAKYPATDRAGCECPGRVRMVGARREWTVACPHRRALPVLHAVDYARRTGDGMGAAPDMGVSSRERKRNRGRVKQHVYVHGAKAETTRSAV